MGAKSTAASAVKKGIAKVTGKAPAVVSASSRAARAVAAAPSSKVSKESPKPAAKPAAKQSAKSTKIISEEEILRAPEKDYMNATQRAFFRARLQEMEQDILRNAGETTEHLRETIIVPDPADRATIEEEHALELRTRDRERKLLKKIQQSIARIDSGDYGYCEETGEPIGIPRLFLAERPFPVPVSLPEGRSRSDA